MFRNFLKLIISIGAVLFLLVSIAGYIAVLFHIKVAGYYPDVDILTLLGILLAFLGIVGGGIYLWILKMVKEDIENDKKQDQALFKSEIRIALGRTSMKLYKTLYEEKTISMDCGGKAKEQIDEALNFVNKAIEAFKAVDVIEHPREHLVNKNNLAYYLARKWNYYRDKDAESDDGFKKYLEIDSNRAKEYLADKSLAENCIDSIKNIKNLEKFLDIIKNVEDTALWVRKVFSVEPKTNLFPRE